MGELLDTLVRLASLGASGISIFAIFWIGWLILRIPAAVDPQRHRTLRFFMLTCVAISLISGATGFVNAKFKADTINELQDQNDAYKNQIDTYKNLQATARGVVKALGGVLESKELAAAESGSPELQRQVEVIKHAVSELASTTRDINRQ